MRRLAFALACAACGGSDHKSVAPDSAIDIDAPPDTGFSVAPHESEATATSMGGMVLTAPHVVPVFFANDSTQQAQLETYLAQLAQSSYWTAITQEYGVGALTVGASVIASETPPTDDSGVQSLVMSHAGGTGGWPAATANTIYAVFLPQGVVETMGGGTSCVDFGGYHSEVTANSLQVVYALLPRCTNSTRLDPLQYNTFATSHELLEASTDPHPYTAPAYNSVDDADAILGLVPGGELGDMCEYVRAAQQPLVGTFMVQRQWSNASAAAGHDPCVPVMPTPYLEATPNLANITIPDGNGGTFTTRGVQVPVGMSKDVEIDLWSDAPAGDFDVVAYDVASMYLKQAAELQVTLDRTSGHNGDKLTLTVKRLKTSTYGVSEFVVFTQVGGVSVGQRFGLVSQ